MHDGDRVRLPCKLEWDMLMLFNGVMVGSLGQVLVALSFLLVFELLVNGLSISYCVSIAPPFMCCFLGSPIDLATNMAEVSNTEVLRNCRLW